jgi:hypothetical protein
VGGHGRTDQGHFLQHPGLADEDVEEHLVLADELTEGVSIGGALEPTSTWVRGARTVRKAVYIFSASAASGASMLGTCAAKVVAVAVISLRPAMMA